jgi:pimeloyl-ACP methyl ester carboxylesterase
MTAITEGFVPFRGYRTGYRIVHDYPDVKGRVPLLMVHGGPGYPWWRPRDDELRLMASGNRPLIFYDQLGCGRSDRPADDSLWPVETFLEELATVRKELDLERVHLYGWSWGGMRVLEYLLSRPQGVQSVVLASALYSVPLFVREVRRLAADLPPYAQAIVRRIEEDYRPPGPAPVEKASASSAPTVWETARKAASLRRADRIFSTSSGQRLAALASRVPQFRAPAYKVAKLAFDHRHLCRLDPWPDQLFEMAAEGNESIYATMWGPVAVAVGSLRDWDVTERLGEIDLPALVISGRYDEVTPVQSEELCAKLPQATRVLLEKSAHMGMLEEAERHWSEVFAFLDRVEAGGEA